MMQRITANAAQAVSFQVASAVGSLVFALVSAVVLEPGLRGDLATYSAVVLLGSVAAALGLPQALIYFSPNGLATRGHIRRFRPLITSATLLTTTVGSAYMLLAESALGDALLVLAVGFGIALSVWVAVSGWLLMGLGKFANVTVARVASTLVLVIGVGLIVVLYDESNSVSLGAFIGVSVLALGVQVAIQWGYARPELPEGGHETVFADLRSYAFRAFPGTALQTCISRLDVLVLAAVAPVAEVGIYAVGLGLADSLMMLPQAVSSALLPAVARDGIGALGSSRRLLAGWLVLQMLATLLFVFGVAVVIPRLLSSSYEGVVLVAAVLAIGNIVLGASRIATSVLNGLGRPGLASLMAGVVVAAMVPLVAVFGGRYGATGAAIGSAIAYTVGAVAMIPVLMRVRGGVQVAAPL